MSRERKCDGCAELQFERWPTLYVALCCDADKAALGRRRILAVSPIGNPLQIVRPVWCREKKEKAGPIAAGRPRK